MDYMVRSTNSRKDTYPLLWIDDILDALLMVLGSQYFSTMDLYLWYWQVKIDPKDIDKTVFVSRQGLFPFVVMAFDLCNAPAPFERLMELVLTELNWKIGLIYLDDVIVYGGKFCDALDRLKTVSAED